MVQYYYINIFLWENGLHCRFHSPAVMSTHHQQWVHSSPTVYEPAVVNPLSLPVQKPAVMALPITIDLNPTPPKLAVIPISSWR